jgi:hypothetical protein
LVGEFLPDVVHYFRNTQNISIGNGWWGIVLDAGIEASNELTEASEEVEVTPNESPNVVGPGSSELPRAAKRWKKSTYSTWKVWGFVEGDRAGYVVDRQGILRSEYPTVVANGACIRREQPRGCHLGAKQTDTQFVFHFVSNVAETQ